MKPSTLTIEEKIPQNDKVFGFGITSFCCSSAKDAANLPLSVTWRYLDNLINSKEFSSF